MIKNNVAEKSEKVFISYLDDDNNKVKGYFDLVKMTDGHIVFLSGKNKITIPLSRLLKMKELK